MPLLQRIEKQLFKTAKIRQNFPILTLKFNFNSP